MQTFPPIIFAKLKKWFLWDTQCVKGKTSAEHMAGSLIFVIFFSIFVAKYYIPI